MKERHTVMIHYDLPPKQGYANERPISVDFMTGNISLVQITTKIIKENDTFSRVSVAILATKIFSSQGLEAFWFGNAFALQ